MSIIYAHLTHRAYGATLRYKGILTIPRSCSMLSESEAAVCSWNRRLIETGRQSLNTTTEEPKTYPGVSCDDDASALLRLILPVRDYLDFDTLLAYSERRFTSRGWMTQW